MRLSVDDIQAVHHWAQTDGEHVPCPACGSTLHHWEFREEPEEVARREDAPTPAVFPLLCRCCGHIEFFPAEKFGLKAGESHVRSK